MGEGSRPPHHTLVGGASARADARLRPSHREGRIVERGRRRGSRTGHGRGEWASSHANARGNPRGLGYEPTASPPPSPSRQPRLTPLPAPATPPAQRPMKNNRIGWPVVAPGSCSLLARQAGSSADAWSAPGPGEASSPACPASAGSVGVACGNSGRPQAAPPDGAGGGARFQRARYSRQRASLPHPLPARWRRPTTRTCVLRAMAGSGRNLDR